MNRRLAAVVLSVATTFTSNSIAQKQQSVDSYGASAADFSHLPSLPKGKSTIMGGQIRNVDPVRDRFSLLVYGEKPMTVLYDERTELYRDGRRIPLRELGPEDHASIQTVLDGTAVFALSIHILSQTPQGDLQGQVLSFNPDTRQLLLSSNFSSPIAVLVPAETQITRAGQSTFTSGHSGFADLVAGALVSISFSPAQKGPAVAGQISVLATPGSRFVLAGKISFLDLESGLLDVVDQRDERSYRIYFDSIHLPVTRKLRTGDYVRIVATYQAPHYVAEEVSDQVPAAESR